ncbi:MAG: hypothetical protein H6819_03330 [Phycisphaerales bacterium]|nr:hypothetical protein [Phycisphaerales bacterium]MCB9856228.1 hypothetical protein [Phycisphaerales bacterium]MCB9863333.1 hypothetical protein [Phycisphaerales bacterium]
MTDRLDQFASLFKSADKPVMVHDDIVVRKIIVVGDDSVGDIDAHLANVRRFLAFLERDNPAWQALAVTTTSAVSSIREVIRGVAPDLIVAHRDLGETSRRTERSLGVILDELLWDSPTPVVVLPDDNDGKAYVPERPARKVMLATDHLTGDNALVDYGARFTPADGTLLMAHIEDDAVFERYMQTIERIPDIESAVARERIRERLLETPQSYIASCIQVLRDAGLSIHVEEVVRFGHRVRDYDRLVDEHGIELLCLHTDWDDAPARLGMAYMIATRCRRLPLLFV